MDFHVNIGALYELYAKILIAAAVLTVSENYSGHCQDKIHAHQQQCYLFYSTMSIL